MNGTQPDKIGGDILIVDNDMPSLQTLSRMLVEQGYEVRGTQNGTAALQFVEKDPPDLILLDILMPEMDGYEVCRQLKTNEKCRDIPVLFLSALDEAGDKVKGFTAGAVDFVTKPYQAEEVLARIDTHLALSRLRTELEKRVEARTAELNESEERYRSLVEASPSAIMTIQDGNFLFTNPAGAKLLGYCDPKEVVGPGCFCSALFRQ